MALKTLCVLLFLVPLAANAQQLAMFSDQMNRAPLVLLQPSDALERRQAGSLFAGRAGLFSAPLIPSPVPRRYGTNVAQLKDLIASAEAGPMGYDAVQHGARIKPERLPTSMTLEEIFAWIKRTPGQPHAIGRYQFIPSTLGFLVDSLDIPHETRFSPDLQDRLANALLEQAGLSDFLAGQKDRTSFMNSIAKIWAGLPNSSGRSHYHGYAGNKAVISWAQFEAEMRQIFPG